MLRCRSVSFAAGVAALTLPLLQSSNAGAVTIVSSVAQWDSGVGAAGIETTTLGVSDRTGVNSVTLADGTTLNLGSEMTVLTIGDGWQTWCCGYAGQILNSDGASQISFDVSPVDAFGFYIEPRNFATYDIALTLADGQRLSQEVTGAAGADFFGWVGSGVSEFSIVADPLAGGFAIGDFFSAQIIAAPEPAALPIFAAGLAGLAAALRRRRRSGNPA
jgi:hypothetical protein